MSRYLGGCVGKADHSSMQIQDTSHFMTGKWADAKHPHAENGQLTLL